jgi:hypothetical protein
MNMKWTLQRLVLGLALGAVLAGGMALTDAHAAAGHSANARARTIEGAWLVHVSVHDCESADDPIMHFQTIVTFGQGGTVTNITTGANPAQRTTAIGTWRRIGGQRFTSVAYTYLFSPAGAWTATQQIATTVDIGRNPDELTGTTKTGFFNTNGDLVATACATVAGNRLR